MCYNYSTCILAWVISCILCFYIITTGKYDLRLPIFILCFTQIQLFEALIWIDIKNENINNNSKHTKKLVFVLLLQQFINYLFGYYTKNNKILLIGLLTSIYSIIAFLTNDNKFFSTIGDNGYLIWNRYDGNDNRQKYIFDDSIRILYMIGLLLPLFY